MVVGTVTLRRVSRGILGEKPLPLSWWIPQKERAVLAVAGSFFWGATIIQALQKDAQGASVVAFFGLGLIYTSCVLANLAGGLTRALKQFYGEQIDEAQPRSLLQLFAILGGMLVCNGVVLTIYLAKQTAITGLDVVSVVAALYVSGVLVIRYGFAGLFADPFSRGWLAVGMKALPQLFLAAFFIRNPQAAAAFTVWALGALTALSGLRFWPTLQAFRRDPRSRHLGGLLLGEAANTTSILLLVLVWALV